MDTLDVNQEEFKELKNLYAQAVKDKKEQFVFKGKDFLTDYAKYVIEWLEPKFKAQARPKPGPNINYN